MVCRFSGNVTDSSFLHVPQTERGSTVRSFGNTTERNSSQLSSAYSPRVVILSGNVTVVSASQSAKA